MPVHSPCLDDLGLPTHSNVQAGGAVPLPRLDGRLGGATVQLDPRLSSPRARLRDGNTAVEAHSNFPSVRGNVCVASG